MTDRPIPVDLVNKVGTVLAYELGHTMVNGRDGIPGPNTARITRLALAALAEWADGALIDPNGWKRYDRGEITLLDESTLMEVVRPDEDPPPGGYREVHVIAVDDIGRDKRPITTITERTEDR